MISLRLLTRNVTPQLTASTQRLHTSKILFNNSSSSDSDSSDDEKRKTDIPAVKKDETNEKSVHRLNALLQSMTQQSKIESKINVAINRKKPLKPPPRKTFSSDHSATKNLFEEKISGAAKEVAASLGGDVNKTESELLKKILSPNTEEPTNLSKLVLGMNIDRTKYTDTNESSNRADQVRAVLQKSNRYTQRQRETDKPQMKEKRMARDMPIDSRVDIDSGSPLNIFKSKTEAVVDSDEATLPTWDLLEKRELKLLVTHPPINYIEQMIRWTEQGRLWRFPIDNEQDMHIDQEEHFSEHVFLEQHLDGWCPSKGPIRHFMELVCVGLSKNPYMLAKDKRERIMWFKDYFASKHDLLVELGAYGTETNSKTQKQVEA